VPPSVKVGHGHPSLMIAKTPRCSNAKSHRVSAGAGALSCRRLLDANRGTSFRVVEQPRGVRRLARSLRVDPEFIVMAIRDRMAFASGNLQSWHPQESQAPRAALADATVRDESRFREDRPLGSGVPMDAPHSLRRLLLLARAKPGCSPDALRSASAGKLSTGVSARNGWARGSGDGPGRRVLLSPASVMPCCRRAAWGGGDSGGKIAGAGSGRYQR